MRELYDVVAKEPVQRNDKTDSGKLAAGEQAFLQGRVQNTYQLTQKLQPQAGRRVLECSWMVGTFGATWRVEGQRSTQQQLVANLCGSYFSISTAATSVVVE